MGLSICFHIQFPIHFWQLMPISLKAEIEPVCQRLLDKETGVQVLPHARPVCLPLTDTWTSCGHKKWVQQGTMLPNTPSVMWHWHPEHVQGERLPDSKSPFPRMLPFTSPVSRAIHSIHIIYVLSCTVALIKLKRHQIQNHTFLFFSW